MKAVSVIVVVIIIITSINFYSSSPALERRGINPKRQISEKRKIIFKIFSRMEFIRFFNNI